MNARVPNAPDSTTEELTAGNAVHAGGYVDILLSDKREVRCLRLSDGESLVVGRSFPATVTFSDRGLSRQHARLTANNGALHVVDLRSTNGIWWRGKRVAETVLRDDESIRLAGVTLLVRCSAQPFVSEQLLSFSGFVAALNDEVTRARCYGRPLSLVFMRFLGEGRGASELYPELLDLLRTSDRLTIYDAGTVAVLLPETAAERARAWVERAAQRCTSPVLTGIASKLSAITSGDALLGAARQALGEANSERPLVFAFESSSSAQGKSAGDGIVVRAAATASIYEQAHRVARSHLPVLITGETGTGKEVLARAIHDASPRRQQAFRAVNCGALPAGLMESILFGHEKGAFTGAVNTQPGIFEQAHGGTLFLDEVGELSPAAQAALLRVLETKTVCRVGSGTERAVDVRILSATHRDLGALGAGGFRQDLLYRLNAVSLALPPLRERREEIPMLVEHFLRAQAAASDGPRSVTPEAMERLLAYSWPGNVRELRNVIERAVALAVGDAICSEDLPDTVRCGVAPRPDPDRGPGNALIEGNSKLTLRQHLQRYEADLMRRALAQADGHKTNAARLLNMPLRTFMKRLREYDLS